MSLILAIEPDHRQASKVTTLAHTLGVELVIGSSTEEVLAALGPRVPDLVLTPQLLAPKDESALSDRLKALDAAGMHAQTLVIPVLGGEEREPKKKGGLFGRLRRTTQEREPGDAEGCDPAVFGKEIMDYLERGAAERAALAAAQADLEAAWADAPERGASVPAESTRAYETTPAGIDVHPEMVIEDPAALFGEFAAIPIRQADAVPVDASLVEPTLVEPTIVMTSGPDESLDDDLPATPKWTPPATPATPATDEEWEEITLDGGAGDPAQSPYARTTDPADSFSGPAVELTSEAMDLDGFVRELHTVESTANAQPMIPVVDLTHVTATDDADGQPHTDAVGAFLPEPVAVTETELLVEARATFEAEVAAAFSSEVLRAAFDGSAVPSDAAPPDDELSTAEGAPMIAPELDLSLASASEVSLDVSPPPSPGDESDAVVAAPSSRVPDYVDAALAAFSPEIEAAQRSRTRTWEPPSESWRTELDTLPPPPAPVVRPSSEIDQSPQIAEPVFGAKWGDVLSSIRRDIDLRRAVEEAQAEAVAKPKTDVATPPLVFPTRSVAPSVIAAIESGAAERLRPEPRAIDALPAPDVTQPDRALAALLESVSTAESLRTPLVPEDTPIETPVVAEWAPAPITEVFPVETMVAAEVREAELDEAGVHEADVHGAEVHETEADPLAWLTPTTSPQMSVDEAASPREHHAIPPVEETALGTLGETATEMPQASARVEEPLASSVSAAPVLPARAMRPPKSKKKRRQQRAEEVSQTVRQDIGDWGFFDPQTIGFGPLVARLNQRSAGMEAFPRA